MAAQSLREHFLFEYDEGKSYRGKNYEHEDRLVLKHAATGIRVWKYALDVRRNKGGRAQVLFHYTPEQAFDLITSLHNQEFRLWASKDARVDSNFGFGLYGTPNEPASWRNKDCIYLNNYWPRQADQPPGLQVGLRLEEYLGTEVHHRIMDRFGGRADFCIPVICDEGDAYDIQQRCTPEMASGGARPGQNRWCEDEPHWRSVWVVRIDRGDDLVEASQQLEKVMGARVEYHSRCFGRSHETTLVCLESLACLHHRRNAFKKAEPLCREVLLAQRQSCGDGHPDTFDRCYKLAWVLMKTSNLTEAESLLREALRGCRQHFGSGDQFTLEVTSALGCALTCRGHFQEAEPLLQEALRCQRQSLGNNHEDTLRSIHSLGLLLSFTGRVQEAWHEAANGLRCRLGDRHVDTLRCRAGLAVLMARNGRVQEGERMYCEALEGLLQSMGADHPFVRDLSTWASKHFSEPRPRNPPLPPPAPTPSE